MEQDIHKVSALRGRPSDENTEELLDFIRNQEKDVNPNVMFENIVLKKACLRPLQDVPLPSITPENVLSRRKKSKSFPGHWSSSTLATWRSNEMVDKNHGRNRKRSDYCFYEKTLVFDNAKDFVKNPSEMRLRTRSLPPLGYSGEEDFQRPRCPTPSRESRCKGNEWEEEYEWKE